MKKFSHLEKEQNVVSVRKKRGKIALAISIILALPLLATAFMLAGYALWARGQHVDPALLPTSSALPIFYDGSGEEIALKTDGYVRAGEASEYLKHAFIAVEDKRFYKHKGYDPVRIGGAIVKNLKAGEVKEGASTITQQLVKNTHLSGERSIERKLKEIALARDLERKYSKDEIMDMYLSVIYFGSGAYGVKSAASKFFGADICELTLAQCATLAGIVKNPAGYSPTKHAAECKKRRDLVLSLMREQGYISEEEYSQALATPLETCREIASDSTDCELYISLAKRQAADMLGMSMAELDASGAKIYTNLDMRVQQTLEKERKNEANFESGDIMSAAAVIDNARSAVLGLSSSLPYLICRQTGSVLKPLAVYAPALDMRAVSLATPIVDEKVTYGDFSPRNFADKYYGETTVEDAVKKSMNSVSVKLLDYIGIENSVKYLGRLGMNVAPENKNYALALGALSASELEIADAYGAIARGGVYEKSDFVRYVVLNGKKITPKKSGMRAFSQSTASLMTSALVQTAKDGTAITLSFLPFEVAAKTGTAERADGKNSDAWIASYNDDVTVAVWHGSDSGMSERGGGLAAQHAKAIWKGLESIVRLSDELTLRGNIAKLDVDEYSSKKLKKVILATRNTPLDYRKSYYFDVEYMPDPCAGLFDAVPPCRFDVRVLEGHVELSFDTLEIYCYALYRTDIFGKALIFSGVGTGEPCIVRDVPIGFGKNVKYELACCVKGKEEICASDFKTVFFEPGFTLTAAA